MKPAATLQVRVVDTEGRPLSEAWVIANNTLPRLNSSQSENSWLKRTGKNGEIEFSALEAGPTTVMAALTNVGRSELKIVELRTDQLSATLLVVQPDRSMVNQRNSVNRGQMDLPGGVRIRGQVVDNNGDGLASVALRVMGRSTMPMRSDDILAVTGPDGRFSISPLLPSVAHRLVIQHRQFGLRLVDFDTAPDNSDAADGPPTLDLGTITLRPGRTISGRVVDDEGRLQAGVPVTLIGWNHDKMERAEKANDPAAPYVGDSWRVLRSDDIGRFFFKNLRAGDYRLSYGRSSVPQIKPVILGDSNLVGLILNLNSTRKLVVEVTSEIKTDFSSMSIEVFEGAKQHRYCRLDSAGRAEFFLPEGGDFFVRPRLYRGIFEAMDPVRVGPGDSIIPSHSNQPAR
ncbi:MAG: carboxypeptidase-like regulatory domain-containing protein [Planctomycetota bacterium]